MSKYIGLDLGTTTTLYAVWKLAPIEVTVTITGHTGTAVYDGDAHTTTGYDVSVSDNRYSKDSISFSGTASASQTIVGTAYMGLEEEGNGHCGHVHEHLGRAGGYQPPRALHVSSGSGRNLPH